MCSNCFATLDVVASQALAAGAALKRPVHTLLAQAGWVRPPDVLADHAHTVAFLKALDLDPVEILGQDVVDATAQWTPAPFVRRRPQFTKHTRLTTSPR